MEVSTNFCAPVSLSPPRARITSGNSPGSSISSRCCKETDQTKSKSTWLEHLIWQQNCLYPCPFRGWVRWQILTLSWGHSVGVVKYGKWWWGTCHIKFTYRKKNLVGTYQGETGIYKQVTLKTSGILASRICQLQRIFLVRCLEQGPTPWGDAITNLYSLLDESAK